MFRFLKSRLFLVLLGFALLAAFIWYAGPYFAFAEYRPLESARARLIAIAVVIALWLLSLVLKRLRASRATDKLIAAVVKPATQEDRPTAEMVQLRERFEEAVATLKRKQRGAHTLYELPWYVIIGAPGSGKTTALVNSGLHFPLEQRTGKGALRGVGGTRNCDWWFTDEAVFLDTAGRYTTQDSDAASDSAGWAEFLSLLRRYRSRRPVNGVILTISAQDLLAQGSGPRDAHVDAARRRLHELNRELRIQLPVYVLVTKCDLLAGFTEYFDDLTVDGRQQVWGVTFPYERTVKGEAAAALPAEIDGLVMRLNERLLGRLEEDRDVRRRARMFAFPQQVAALRDVLADFVGEVFGTTRFDQQVLLRGLYFTSGTQEGTPVDRLLGALGRRFALAPDAVAPPAGRGKAYFIEHLLKHVLFAESGLAGVNRRLEVKKAASQLGAYAAMAFVAAAGVLALSVSYHRNRAYLAEIDAEVSALRQAPRVASASLDTLLPRLDAVRAVVESARRYADDQPWSMRWGLFQGTSIGNAAADAYLRELDGALLPQVAARFRQRLVDYGPEPEKLYEYLKAYLMLGQPQHLERAQLAYLADREWEAAYGDSPDTRASLSSHFHRLLEWRETLRPIPLDESLVAQARSAVRRASIARLIYDRLLLTYATDEARALHLDVALGIGANQVFRRKSGTSLADPIPGIYTRAVFEEITSRDTAALVKEFESDRWVWGDEGLTLSGSSKLAAEVIDIYEKEYIAAWDAVMRDLQPVPFPTLEKITQALGTLAAPTSPLRALLLTVDENTFLVKPPEAGKDGGVLASAQRGVRDRFDKIFGAAKGAAAPPGIQITTHFAPVHRLVAGAPAPIDGVLAKLGQIQQQLAAVGGSVGQTSPTEALVKSGAGALLRSLQDESTALPPLVRALVTQIGGRTEQITLTAAASELDAKYRSEVLRECSAITSDRYPFATGSTYDVPLADFGRLFGPNGIFDSFFKANLAPLVDTTRSPWTWRAGAPSGVSPGMLAKFEVAQHIRETFFGTGAPLPELRFTVTPADLDAAATRFTLEIDGQTFDYRHGPERSWPAVWPGPNPGVAAATFEARSGGGPNNLVFQGPWALFRLIDAAQVRRDTDVRYIVSFQKGEHVGRVKIEAASIRNPLATRDVQQFRCVPLS